MYRSCSGSLFGQLRRILPVLLAVAVMLLGNALAADSGTLGDLTWKLSDEYVLTISGSGEIPDFPEDLTGRPWTNNLIAVNIGEGVSRIGVNAFSGCNQLKNIVLPKSTASVGANAFAGCALLETIELANPETILAEGAYPASAGIVSYGWQFDLSGSTAVAVEWLGDTIEATLPAAVGGKTVASIAPGCFSQKAPTSVTLPADFVPVADVFAQDMIINTDSNTSFRIDEGGVTLVKFNSNLAEPELPAEWGGQTVIGIDHANIPNALSIRIPDGVHSIGDYAFYLNSKLAEVIFPEGLESIGRGAFWGCGDELKSVSLPGMHVAVGASTFDKHVDVYADVWVYRINGSEAIIYAWNGNDEILVVPDLINTLHLTAFEPAVFKNKTFLKEVTLPDEVHTLGNSLFYGCTALTSADLGETAEILPAQTFFGCRLLKNVVLPDALKKINRYAFGNCVVLSNIAMPADVEEIGANAFSGCAGLVEAPLPVNLKILGNNAFYNCNSLTEVDIPDAVTNLGEGIFTGCAALETVNIGKGVTYIGSKTFAGLKSLKHLTIESAENMTVTIASSAFANCTALQDVSVGAVEVQSNAFQNCTALSIFSADIARFTSSAFSGCSLLKRVEIDKVTGLPQYAFSNLTSLEYVHLGNPDQELTIPYSAFKGCIALKTVEMGWNWIGVDSYAFYDCSSLENIELSGSTKTIGSYAFANCAKLNSFAMPDGLTTIGNNAFYNCPELAEVHLNIELLEICENAFANCYALQRVDLPNNVQTVAKGAFPNQARIYCNPTSAAAISISANGGSFVSPENEMFGIRLLLDGDISLGLSVEQIWTDESSVQIPEYIGGETVTEIGANVFSNCPGVTTVTLPASVPVLPAEMLKGNETLTKVIIPEGVTGIGKGAFQNCSKLVTVTIPNTVTSIGDYAFDGCSMLKVLNLSDDIQEVGVDAFKGIKVYCGLDSNTALMLSRTGGGFVCHEYPLMRLKYLFVGGEAVSLEVIGVEGGAASIQIPDSVTSIAAGAFQDMTYLKSVIIPDSVTSIGANAFNGSGITSIALPASVTKIEKSTFANTLSLKEITIDGAVTEVGAYAFENSTVNAIEFKDGLVSVGEYAFRNAIHLQSAVMPDSTKTLGQEIFSNCKNLASFKVPAGVEIIPSYAFYDCAMLEAVEVPEGVTDIKYHAFKKSGLASINLPSTLNRIESYSFEGCIGLNSVQMCGDMEFIGSHAFSGCINLKTLKLPDTLAEMNSYAFQNCESLKNLELPLGLTSIPDSAFYNCDKLSYVKIAEGVQKLENQAFRSCDLLESIDLPSTLLEIGEYAFYGCSKLKVIDLPDDLKMIKAYAFAENDMLTNVVLPKELNALGNYAFSNCDSLESIVIPGSLLYLPQHCFESCHTLKNVTIEEGVRSINDQAFAYCYKLGAILIPKSVSTVASNTFYGINANVPTVYCYHDTEGEHIAQENGFGIIYLDGENMLEGLHVEALETEMNIGLNKQLENIDKLFVVKPENIPYNAKLHFYAENEEIAIVENGVLTGMSVGETNLVGCLADNNEILARIKIYVRENITDFILPDEIWQLKSEPLTLLPVSTTPEGANDGYKWTLADNLGIIEDNVLTPSACGTTTLTALSWNDVERSTTLHIYNNPTKVSFVNVPAGADVGTDITLEPVVQAGAVFTGKLANHFLTYTSSDENIATVSQDGVVTTTGYGTAVISAKTENNVVGKAYIYVSAPITSFNLQGRVLAAVGSTIELAATEIQPANAHPNAFVWTTEPEGLVSYANGRVTVLTDQEAEVTITATTWDGKLSKSTHMTIYRPAVESIHIEPIEWIEPYKYIQMTARVKAVEEFTNQLVTWSVDDSYYATIDQNGLLYTNGHGWKNQITVTATADNGVSDSLTLYVVYPTTSFEVPDRIILQTGATKTVKPTKVFSQSVTNELESSYQKFSMKFNSDLFASADGMNITGLKPGMAELTVTSWNGLDRKVPVLVYDPITSIDVAVKESQLPNASYPTDLLVQKYYNMQSWAQGDQIYENDLVTWTSSDPSVIRVEDANTGRIRTVNYGTATLTASAENGTTGSIVLNVRKEVDTFFLPDEIEAYVLADKELQVAYVTPMDAYDAFVWTVEPATLGTIEGNILHVAADAPTQGRLIASSWEGYVTKETKLSIIQDPVTQISIDPVGRMTTDSEQQLAVHVTAGAEYLNQWVSYSSSNNRIATVDADGSVHAHAPGFVTITARAANGVNASVTIEVIRGVDTFTVPEKIWIETGKNAEIQIEGIEPDDSLKEFIWISANEELLTIEPGEQSAVLTAVSEFAADTTVTVKSWNDVERTIEIAIYEPATKVELSGMPVGIAPGAQVSLDVRVEAGNIFGKELVSFRSTDENIAIVDENGLVTAVDYGCAQIIAEAESGASGSVTVRVSKPITDFSLPARFLAAAGTTIELQANDVLPVDAQTEAIEWIIEPAELGTINGNRFTAAIVDGMSGTVTARSWDGSIEKSTVLQVYKPQVTDITIEAVPRLWRGAEYQLIAHVYADGTDYINELVTFSSNSSYASVDENGLIRYSSYGWNEYVTITATAENGVSASVSFYVSDPITDFTLKDNLLIQTGASKQISVKEYTGDNYGWSYRADDSGVVSVNDRGWITALKPGDAVVTVKAWSGLEKTINVHVHDAVTEVIIDPVQQNQRIIEEIQLNVRAIAEREYGNELITWTTSDNRIATVSATGLVKTLNYGEVIITATAGNGVYASIPLRVAREVATFSLPAEFTAYAEGMLKLEVASIAPANAHNEFIWTVEPTEIGYVENGILYVDAKEACEGTLTAVSWDNNVTRTAALRILKEPVTNVSIDAVEADEIIVGKQQQLIARVTAGIEHENRYVSWTSSDESIATVSEKGVVSAISAGSATITATSDNGLSASIDLVFVQGVDSFEVPESILVYCGYPEKLEISNVLPANAEDRPFTYTVEPADIAKVEDGMIVPLVSGDGIHRTGTITVTSWNGVSRTINFTVKNPYVTNIEIEPLPELHNDMTFQVITKVTVDGKEYINRFVSFWIENGSSYATIDSETGEVTISDNNWDYDLGISVNFSNGSEYIGQRVYPNITDFEVASPLNPPKFGDEIELTAYNFKSPAWNPRTDVAWTAEPADAVSIEDNMLTILTKDAVDVTVTATAWNGLERSFSFTTVAVQDIENFTLPSRVLLPVGGAVELKLNSVSPAGIGVDHFTWTVEPAEAAIVENGVLRALADHEMTATLTATSWNGISRSTSLQVYAPNVTAIELEPITLYTGLETQLMANVWVDGEVYINQYVRFEMYTDRDLNNPISNYYGTLTKDGYLTLEKGAGSNTLYLKISATNGFSIVEEFRIYKAFDSIDIKDCFVVPLNEQATVSIDAYVPTNYGSPSLYNYDNQADIVFSSADEDMLYINDECSGDYIYIQGIKVGETTLTAKGRNSTSDTARVVVYDTIESVTVDAVGPQRIYSNVQMNADVVANGMTVSNQLVSWSTSDPAIASVNANGVVRTVGYGTVTITATTYNGLTASTELSVYEDTQDFTVPEGMSVVYGDSIELNVCNVVPDYVPQTFTWTVEPADAATIEGNVLTPLYNDDMQLTVTATSWDGLSRSQTVQVLAGHVMFKLPAALQIIEDEAFEGCMMYGLILPEGCKSIGTRAFANSEILQRVQIPESVTSIAANAFDNSPNVQIIAPAGSYAEGYAAQAGIPFIEK